ncbi:MAG: serine/threonine-protein kinase RsbT [Halanaerobiales bacterium]|nr:serine/threonine-protein kinase RsbT [Halanaerobiales bacterium]
MKEQLILEKAIEKGDFNSGGEVSSKLKELLRKLGVRSEVIRKAAIVTYELEMNVIIHSEGGGIRVTIAPEGIILYVEDTGPGIPDLKKAFQPGYSTASDEVREMGFGAGMGLNNVKRYSDNLDIKTGPGEATRIRAVINLS